MNTLTHTRTVNGGTPELITTRAAIAEIETVMNAGHNDGTEMYGSGSTYSITYPDGRKVNIRPATPEQIAELSAVGQPAPATPEHTADGRRIVTVNGKRYIIANRISAAKTTVIAGNTHVWPGGVKYWTERNGDTFGPIRTALANSKPGTVGAAIWAAANG